MLMSFDASTENIIIRKRNEQGIINLNRHRVSNSLESVSESALNLLVALTVCIAKRYGRYHCKTILVNILYLW